MTEKNLWLPLKSTTNTVQNLCTYGKALDYLLRSLFYSICRHGAHHSGTYSRIGSERFFSAVGRLETGGQNLKGSIIVIEETFQ